MMNKKTFSSKKTVELYKANGTFFDASSEEAGYLENLEAGMRAVAKQAGMNEEEAAAAASAIMNTILSYEETAEKVSENPAAAVEEAFQELSTLEPDQRLDILHQMYFSLCLFTDKQLTAQLKTGVAPEKLYGLFRERTDLSEETLRTKILTLVTEGNLTPDALDLLAANVAKLTGDYTFTQAAVGYNGLKYKCLVAMKLYLSKQDTEQPITPEEAALTTCATADIQGLAHAFLAGNVVKWTILLLTFAKIISVIIKAAKLIVLAPTVSKIFLIAVVALLLMEGYSELGQFLAALTSKAVVAGVPLIKKGIESFKEAISDIRQTAAEKHTEVQPALEAKAELVIQNPAEETAYRPLTSYI